MTTRISKALRLRLSAIRLAVFDFDGVFTDNHVLVSDTGRETVRCCRSDGLGLRRLHQAGVESYILSGEVNPIVTHRSRKLGISAFRGVENKLEFLTTDARRRGLSMDEIAFVGNDINDLACLRAVGVAVVVADAWPEVKTHADWILSRNGGYGAVREFCDAVWNVRQTA